MLCKSETFVFKIKSNFGKFHGTLYQVFIKKAKGGKKEFAQLFI